MSPADRPYFVLVGKNNDAPRFSAKLLGEALLDEAPAARDGGGRLYAYHDDAWRPDGEAVYERRVRDLMGDLWLPKHASETVQWIAHGAPLMDEQPPRDRVRVVNGVLHLAADGTPTLEPPGVDPLTPVRLPVRYDPKAKCPRFRRFLTEVVPAAAEATVQELLGYLLVPDNSQQKAFLFYGPGGNGKSTLVRVIEALLGVDNVASCSLKSLSDDRFAAADLYGKLANAVADITSEEVASLSTFRAITGGDRLRAERKYERAFDFRPYARLIFSVNRYPPMRDPTNATFARWVVVPFDQQLRGTKAEDKALTRKLTTAGELSGILNYALGGLQRLRANGTFTVAAASADALARFRLAADTVAMFLAEEAFEPGFHRRVEVYEAFRMWCGRAGHRDMSRNQFYDRARAVLGDERRVQGHDGWQFSPRNRPLTTRRRRRPKGGE